MKNKISLLIMVLIFVSLIIFGGGCSPRESDESRTIEIANKLKETQSTPTDINYSLERYNLIKRAYWVNGQREKALSLPCLVDKPLGYIVLFNGNTTVCSFVVDGKVSSLNSFLTPESTYYSVNSGSSEWLSDVDGSYGSNDQGIFFFTPDGKYVEWKGNYLYTDIPIKIKSPVVVYTKEISK